MIPRDQRFWVCLVLPVGAKRPLAYIVTPELEAAQRAADEVRRLERRLRETESESLRKTLGDRIAALRERMPFDVGPATLDGQRRLVVRVKAPNAYWALRRAVEGWRLQVQERRRTEREAMRTTWLAWQAADRKQREQEADRRQRAERKARRG